MMHNKDFVERLRDVFNGATMADVARRLNIPHATVRNYYKGRLPASEVLVKIANETGVSLNWLLMGKGEKYAGQSEPIGLGRFLEEKIGQIIEQKLSVMTKLATSSNKMAGREPIFDIEAAVMRLDDPQAVISEWFRYENREYPSDYGVVFFRGWETFSLGDKIDAVIDAKKVLDRTLASVAA